MIQVMVQINPAVNRISAPKASFFFTIDLSQIEGKPRSSLAAYSGGVPALLVAKDLWLRRFARSYFGGRFWHVLMCLAASLAFIDLQRPLVDITAIPRAAGPWLRRAAGIRVPHGDGGDPDGCLALKVSQAAALRAISTQALFTSSLQLR